MPTNHPRSPSRIVAATLTLSMITLLAPPAAGADTGQTDYSGATEGTIGDTGTIWLGYTGSLAIPVTAQAGDTFSFWIFANQESGASDVDDVYECSSVFAQQTSGGSTQWTVSASTVYVTPTSFRCEWNIRVHTSTGTGSYVFEPGTSWSLTTSLGIVLAFDCPGESHFCTETWTSSYRQNGAATPGDAHHISISEDCTLNTRCLVHITTSP